MSDSIKEHPAWRGILANIQNSLDRSKENVLVAAEREDLAGVRYRVGYTAGIDAVLKYLKEL